MRKEYYLAHREEILLQRKARYLDPLFREWKRNYDKNYRETERGKDIRNTYQRQWLKKIKLKVFEHYGKSCVCCGMDTLEFLTIDHINGKGRQHKISNKIGSHMYEWLVKNNFPEGFRILCFNCNCARGFYGFCPHNELK